MLWSKGKQIKDIDGYKRRTQVKRHLINIRGHQCEECKNTQWLTKPITLELEHIDGDNTNNLSVNLKLLCPNCHSYTSTWRRRKKLINNQHII